MLQIFNTYGIIHPIHLATWLDNKKPQDGEHDLKAFRVHITSNNDYILVEVIK